MLNLRGIEKKNCLGEETQTYLKYESKLWIVVKNLKAFKVDNTPIQINRVLDQERRNGLYSLIIYSNPC